MNVSPRFRDIFSSGPIATRRSDPTKDVVRREALSDLEFDRRTGELQVDLIWLEIAHAHQRAARAFTPEFVRVEDLAGRDKGYDR